MTDEKTESGLTGVALYAALVVMAAWLVLLTWLAFHTGMNETQWARLGSVLGSLEAVAFAAAGAFFGTTVQKQRVQEANERADKAAQTSKENLQAAANGRALATAVKARAATAVKGIERVSVVEGLGCADDALVALANKLFPE